MISLRPYQKDAIERTRLEMRRQREAESKESVVIVAPTGAGKTIIGCSIMDTAFKKGSRILFLAHRTELIDQCAEKLAEIGLGEHVGIIKAGRTPAYYRQIQVASVQTLVQRQKKLDFVFDVIIIDECHHARASTYGAILSKYPDAVVIGLTATPYRADGKGLGDVFGAMVEVTTVEKLIAEGFLVPTKVFSGSAPDLKGLKIVAGEYDQKQLDRAMRDKKLEGDIVREWKEHGEGRPTICFATNIEHSIEIRDRFRAEGISCDHVDGNTPAEERDAILGKKGKLARGLVQIVTNVGVATEGWDCPIVSCCIMARPTKSRCLWRQMVGRVIRIHEGKHDAIILDHAGTTKEHGFITDPDHLSLADGIKGPARSAQTYQCPNPKCHAVLRSYPKFCPACGQPLRAEQRKQCEIHIDDGVRLTEITPQRRAQEFYRDLVDKAVVKKLKPGWVQRSFHEKYGRWPTEEDKKLSAVRTAWVADSDGTTQLEFVHRQTAAAGVFEGVEGEAV